MTTPIADMVAQMFAANVPHDAVVLAVAAVERTVAALTAAATGVSTNTSTISTGGPADIGQEPRRLRERLKKAKWRAKRKNSPQASSGGQVDASTVTVVDMVDMSTTSPLSLTSSFKKVSSSEREARARARPCPPVDIPAAIPADFRLSPEDEQFASDRGWSPAEIADVLLKFKNRSLETGRRSSNWSLAWQNWVIDERRPLRVVAGGKAGGKADDPFRKARQFTEAEWRRKCALVATDPSVAWPELSNHPTRNKGVNRCMAQ